VPLEAPNLEPRANASLKELKAWLDRTPWLNVNSGTFQEGHTPLMMAAMGGHHEGGMALLAFGADVDTRDLCGKTALAYAAEKGQVQALQILISHGADRQARDESNHFILGINYLPGQSERWVQTLQESGITLQTIRLVRGQEKPQMIVTAFFEDLSACVRIYECVSKLRQELSRQDRGYNQGCKLQFHLSSTPLMVATKHGHTEAVKALIGAGADINAQDNQGRTALMLAAAEGQVEMVNLLCKSYADLSIQDHRGGTAHSHASSNVLNVLHPPSKRQILRDTVLGYVGSCLGGQEHA
jgi:uncharacterized protein